MKPKANIIFFGTAKFGYKLIDSNPNWFSYDLIWEKSRPTGHLNSKVAFLRKHENLYIFKDKGAVYHPQMVLRDKPLSVMDYIMNTMILKRENILINIQLLF